MLQVAPIITEKSMDLAKTGKYTFSIAKGLQKNQIKKIIEKMFKVNVVHISIVLVKGRTQRTGMRRVVVKLPKLKKAIVTVKKDQKIELFEAQG